MEFVYAFAAWAFATAEDRASKSKRGSHHWWWGENSLWGKGKSWFIEAEPYIEDYYRIGNVEKQKESAMVTNIVFAGVLILLVITKWKPR